MDILRKVSCLIFSGLLHSQFGYSQIAPAETVPLSSLDAFAKPAKNWVVASDASADFNKAAALKPLYGGDGTIVNTAVQNGENLVTRKEYGDFDLELDVMMAKTASSGVFIQGRYELQLTDSWTKLSPTYADIGGIAPIETDALSGFNGKAPFMNVARAPGLWQHLRIKFRAPKFNAEGTKISNACFEEVYLNGTLIQDHVILPALSKDAIFTDEKATGPFMLKGDKGSVAFRRIAIREFPAPQPEPAQTNTGNSRRFSRVTNPIALNPNGKAYVLRSFVNFADKKRTHVVSVGYPNEMNYSYDVKQGALLQLWRGQFEDVTQMWDGRGEPQLAVPLGSILPLSAAPTLAVLPDESTVWPDSILFDDMHNKGYTLDKERTPTFRYEVSGYHVSDKISAQHNGESVLREISVANAPANLYCRIAAATNIVSMGKGLYAVDDRSYYIQVDKRFRSVVRTIKDRQELIVAIAKDGDPLTYSIIW